MNAIVTPLCPECGSAPELWLSVHQVFCSNDDCSLLCWDTTKTKDELEKMRVEIGDDE